MTATYMQEYILSVIVFFCCEWDTLIAVCVRVSVASTHYVVLLIYRPGSAAATAEFFMEFSVALDSLFTLSAAFVVADDISV